MTIENVPIGSLLTDPANLRKHNQRNIDAIRASLLRWGQQRPLVVDAKNIVACGNGTLQAARELGWTHIGITRTALTGADLTAFAIADNRSAELAEWADELPDALAALAAADPTLTTAAGFTADELAAMTGATDPESPPGDFATVGEDIETEHCCPKCGYRWSGNPDPVGEGAE